MKVLVLPEMHLDLKNTGQIFQGNEARFFNSIVVSFILLKMDFFTMFAMTLPIFLRVFPNFLVPTEKVSLDYL